MRILFPYMARWKAVNWTRYHSLLTCLAQNGNEVFVLQPPSVDSQETNFVEVETELPPNLHLIDINIPGWLWRMKVPVDKLVKKGLYCIFSLNKGRRIIRDYGVDILFLYNIPQYPYLSLPVRKIVFDYADDYVAMLSQELGPFRNPVTSALGEIILKRMVARASHVFAVSHVLARKFGAKVKVLPNGVDFGKVDLASRQPLLRKFQRPVIGFIGSFEYFIDFDLILEVAHELPMATFLLVGRGRLWNYVKEQVAARGLQNVLLPGGVQHQDVFRYIGLMDICLNIFKKIPISQGACPIKLFEYLSMRKPVISTRLDEVQYLDKGFLLYGDESKEVIDNICRLLGDESLRLNIAERGYVETMRRYTWESIAEEFIQTVGQDR